MVDYLSEIILDDRILNEKAEVISERLPGVIVEKNRINVDDRGTLVSLIRADDTFAIDNIEYRFAERWRDFVLNNLHRTLGTDYFIPLFYRCHTAYLKTKG